MDSQLDLFRPLPETSSPAMEAFCTDCARKIHDGDAIASRYGFFSKDALKAWLGNHPAVFRKIKELQAVWESDANVEVRARTLAGYATIEAIPAMTQIVLDPVNSPGQRTDGFKEIARVGGLSSPPPVPRDGGSQGAPGVNNRFSVQIVFASTGQVESFTTREPAPVIDARVEDE